MVQNKSLQGKNESPAEVYMFKAILDISYLDYNAIFDTAMDTLKDNPQAPKWATGKIPSKIEGFLFKRMSDEQKNTMAATALNQESGTLLTQLEQAVSRICYIHPTALEAKALAPPQTGLRLYLDVATADYDRAADYLTNTLLREEDIPEAFGSHWHPGITKANAREAIVNLPVPEKELVLLRILRINKDQLLRSIEMASRLKHMEVRFADIRFMVPR